MCLRPSRKSPTTLLYPRASGSVSHQGRSQNAGFPSHSQVFLPHVPLSHPTAARSFPAGKMPRKEGTSLCYPRITAIRSHCCGNADVPKAARGKAISSRKADDFILSFHRPSETPESEQISTLTRTATASTSNQASYPSLPQSQSLPWRAVCSPHGHMSDLVFKYF